MGHVSSTFRTNPPDRTADKDGPHLAYVTWGGRPPKLWVIFCRDLGLRWDTQNGGSDSQSKSMGTYDLPRQHFVFFLFDNSWFIILTWVTYLSCYWRQAWSPHGTNVLLLNALFDYVFCVDTHIYVLEVSWMDMAKLYTYHNSLLPKYPFTYIKINIQKIYLCLYHLWIQYIIMEHPTWHKVSLFIHYMSIQNKKN